MSNTSQEPAELSQMPELKAELKSDLKAVGKALHSIGRIQVRQLVKRVSCYIPIMGWLPKYDRSFLNRDLISGLTVWGVSVPTALAYAQLAGVPPQAGLYAACVSLLVYSIFTTSRQVKCTASSTVAVMSAAIVAPLALGDGAYFWALTSMLALIVGIMLVGAGIARLGFIADFLSKPVVTGFIFGLAISVVVGQLPKLFGVPRSEGNVFQQFFALLGKLGQTNLFTLAVGVGALALIFILRRRAPQVPASLVALAAGILVSWLLKLDQWGVSTIGQIPLGFPHFGWPAFKAFDVPYLIGGALGIVFLAVGESLGSARAFAAKHHYAINADQELIAMGLANVGSGFSQGLTVDASMSISATADASGARTPLSGLVTAGMLLLTLLLLGLLFGPLPNAVLAVIIIVSSIRLMDVREMRRIYSWRRSDFVLAMTALVGVLVSDVLSGLMWAVFLSLTLVLYRVSRPNLASLGQVTTPRVDYVDLARHSDARPVPGLAIFRLDAPLFFANAAVAEQQIKEHISERTASVREVLIDMGGSWDLDVTSMDMLHDLVGDLREQQLDILLAQTRSRARKRLKKTGLLDYIGSDRIFYSVQAAVADFQHRFPGLEEEPPLQSPFETDDQEAMSDVIDGETLDEEERQE